MVSSCFQVFQDQPVQPAANINPPATTTRETSAAAADETIIGHPIAYMV